MGAFDCPNCGEGTSKLIIYESPKKYLGCPACGVKKAVRVNANLHQVIDHYPKKDGSIGKITVGKNSEINNRIMKDGRIINSQSGRDAQY